VYALRRETLREFPEAQPGGFVASVRSMWAKVQGEHEEEDSAAAEIARLGDLRTAGLISDDEFARGKARALA
jgi:hypothetical protein